MEQRKRLERGALTRRSVLLGAALAGVSHDSFALTANPGNERPGPSGGSIPALREDPGTWIFRPEWVNQIQEAPLEPELPILDAQHHFHDRSPGMDHFDPDDLIVTIKASGHKVVGTIYCDVNYRRRKEGPEEMRTVGEIEAVRENAEYARKAAPELGIARGIVGFADLALGEKVQPVLEAMMEAGKGRLCGIRYMNAVWDPDPKLRRSGRPGAMAEPEIRENVKRLGRMGLTYNAFIYHPQLPELADLARACPDTTIVIDHTAMPVRAYRFAANPEAALEDWRRGITAVAKLPNVYIKIGGLASPRLGIPWQAQPLPPTSDDLVKAWGPLIDHCINAFGPSRSILESDYTIQRPICTYSVLWNAFKKATQKYSASERRMLFGGAAEKAYPLMARA